MTAVAVAASLALSACSGGGAPSTTQAPGGGSGGGGNSGYTFAMITHETPGDTFWDRVRSGAEQAAKNTGSKLNYSNDPDPAKQSTLIQTAVQSKVDGLATTLTAPPALKGAVQSARSANIPVVAFNAGLDQYKDVGALMYFGSDESLAGQSAGQRMASTGIKHPLCVIHEAGSVSLEARCAGVKKAIGNTENIQVNGADDSAVTSSLQAKLRQDSSLDGVITLGAPYALDAIKALDASSSKAKLATFDLNIDTAKAVQDGKVVFAVDQQPYLQGYLAIESLYLYKLNGNDIGGGKPVLTGPSFVDSSNIATILPFVQNNTR